MDKKKNKEKYRIFENVKFCRKQRQYGAHLEVGGAAGVECESGADAGADTVTGPAAGADGIAAAGSNKGVVPGGGGGPDAGGAGIMPVGSEV